MTNGLTSCIEPGAVCAIAETASRREYGSFGAPAARRVAGGWCSQNDISVRALD
jgi:hypothetical protein